MKINKVTIAIYMCAVPYGNTESQEFAIMLKVYPDQDIAKERVRITATELGEHYHLITTSIKEINIYG